MNELFDVVNIACGSVIRVKLIKLCDFIVQKEESRFTNSLIGATELRYFKVTMTLLKLCTTECTHILFSPVLNWKLVTFSE